MTASIALLLTTAGAGLVAGQGPPPGATVEVQVGWLLAALGVLGLVVAAVLSDRSDRAADRAAARGDGPAWFWAPLEDGTEPGDSVAAATPARRARQTRPTSGGPQAATWRFRVPSVS